MRAIAVPVPVALVLSLITLAYAQALEATPPPDRFVAPGESVTLEFVLEAEQAIQRTITGQASCERTPAN